ncbi:glycosyltransferase family 9 protein [Candidatus Chlorohelix sp.]|uniref:glycosyltransferase family 9 protein n=1 Tax=Candidatus Chlorohelix sp. TaxID=3139201 RepID=UPI0030408088
MSKSKPIKKILAIKLADLGDTLAITPALRALREAYPDATIEVLTTNGGAVLEDLPYLNRVIYFNKYLFDEPRQALKPNNLWVAFRFLLSLTLARYDTVILFHHLTLRFGVLKYAALLLSTLAMRRVGLDNGRGWFLNLKIADRGFDAATERAYWLEVVSMLGAKSDNTRPEIPLNEKHYRIASELRDSIISQEQTLLVAIHPGSGGYSLARRWQPSGFAGVADALVERFGTKIALVGGLEEHELCEQVIKQMRFSDNAVNLAGKTGVREVTAFLGMCDLFIGNDAGLMHLAATVGAPLVGIFGPTNPQAWQPYGTQGHELESETKARRSGSIIVRAELELPCRPCLYRGMELGSRTGCAPRPCLSEIKVEQVVAAAQAQLEKHLQVSMKPDAQTSVYS